MKGLICGTELKENGKYIGHGMSKSFLIGNNEFSRLIKKEYSNGTRSSFSASWNIYRC